MKFILILGLFLFLFIRLSGFIMRVLGGGRTGGTRAGSYTGHQRTTPRDGNVNVDFVPRKKKKPQDYKGGDYIDYEEVKEN